MLFQINYKIITLDLDFGFLFSKYPKATIIIVRPRILLPERIIEIVDKWLDKIMCGERINYIDRRQNKDQKIRIAPLRISKINFSIMRMSFRNKFTFMKRLRVLLDRPRAFLNMIVEKPHGCRT